MNGKNVAAVVGSFVGGVGVGVFLTKGYFKKKYEAFADNEIEEMENYLKSLLEEALAKDVVHSYASSQGDEVNPVPDPPERDLEAPPIRGGERVDYTKFFPTEEDASENSEEETENEEEVEVPDEAFDLSTYEDWHNRNKNKSPKIISLEATENLPNWIAMEVLLYYTEDNVITDEDDQIIDEAHRLIGNCLDKYGFAENDEKEIYVLNPSLDTCYNIVKVKGERLVGYDD